MEAREESRRESCAVVSLSAATAVVDVEEGNQHSPVDLVDSRGSQMGAVAVANNNLTT